MPIDKKYLAPFAPGEYYHIYNRCPSHKKMFIDTADYEYFLSLLNRYLIASLDVYAYSLIPNHFHLFVKIIESKKQQSNFDTNEFVTNQFRKLFITYSGYNNMKCKTHGAVFSRPFKRIRITDEFHFSQVIYYIHANAVHHGICEHPSQYAYSSYQSMLSTKPTLLKRQEVLDWFGGREQFIRSHDTMNTAYLSAPFFIE